MTAAQREEKNRKHREYIARRRRDDPVFAQSERDRVRIWRADKPGVTQAWALVAHALEKGDLVRPDRCDECERESEISAAHEDYTRPLDVRWLCDSCHTRWDADHPKAQNIEKANEMALTRRAAHEARKWGRVRMIDAGRAWADQHGRSPFVTIWMRSAVEHPCASAVIDAFGSWPAFLDACGLPANRRGRPRLRTAPAYTSS